MDADLNNYKTQQGKILKLLVEARAAWVPLMQILGLGVAQYNTRILELRRLGFVIQNKTETVNRQRHSWFRLIPGAERQQSLRLTGKENPRLYPD